MERSLKDVIRVIKENEWYKPIKLIILISLSTLLVVLVILGIPSLLGGEEWIGFWGGIAGSIIGGAITIIALRKTIEFEREKEEENTRIQNQPYFICMLYKEEKLKKVYTYRTHNYNEIKDIKRLKFSIKNIGGNSAVDIRPHEIWINTYLSPEIYRCSEVGSELLIAPYLEKNGKIDYCIDIFKLNAMFEDNDIIKVKFIFSDLFGCYYTQEIQFIIYGNEVNILDIKQPKSQGKIFEVFNK